MGVCAPNASRAYAKYFQEKTSFMGSRAVEKLHSLFGGMELFLPQKLQLFQDPGLPFVVGKAKKNFKRCAE